MTAREFPVGEVVFTLLEKGSHLAIAFQQGFEFPSIHPNPDIGDRQVTHQVLDHRI